MLFRPGRVLLLVATLVLVCMFVMQFMPKRQAESNQYYKESIREGGLVEEQIIQQVSAIEAKHRQWDSTVWANELIARDYEESIIQIWDKLLAGADPFELLARMPVNILQLGKPQPTEDWESNISYTRLAQGGPSWSKEQLNQALGKWKSEGWKLDQSEWRHRHFTPGDKVEPSSVFWISLHLINKRLNRRGILRGNITVKWQSIEITP